MLTPHLSDGSFGSRHSSLRGSWLPLKQQAQTRSPAWPRLEKRGPESSESSLQNSVVLCDSSRQVRSGERLSPKGNALAVSLAIEAEPQSLHVSNHDPLRLVQHREHTLQRHVRRWRRRGLDIHQRVQSRQANGEQVCTFNS